MKRFIKLFTTGLLSLSIIFSAGGIKNVSAAVKATPIIKLDGTVISFPADGIPYIDDNDRTMVSARFVTESMKCKVDWSESEQQVIITKGDKMILLKVGNDWATVIDNATKHSEKKSFDTKAVVKNNRTFVPLRFISESLGAGIVWDEVNYTVIVRSDGTVEHVAKSWKNVEVPMSIVGSDEMPEGFIKPQFVIKHHASGSAGYFDIELKNINDYKETAGNYTFKITCLNYDVVNWTYGIPDIKRTDNIRYLSNSFKYKYVNPNLWGSPSQDVKFADYPELGEVTIKPGTVLEMQVEFYYAGLKQIYKNSVELKPEVEE